MTQDRANVQPFPKGGANDAAGRPAADAMSKEHLPVLTGLRFLAAFLVLVAHAAHTLIRFANNTFWLTFGYDIVWVGMSLFFVLSGFVIQFNYGELFERKGLGAALHAFGSARFARIYPLFLFFLVIAVATTGANASFFSNCSYGLCFFLTATQSWLPLMCDNKSLMLQSFYPHSWSISTEIFFYFLYPLLALALLRLKRPTHIGLAMAAMIVAAFTGLSALFAYRKEWGPPVFQFLASSANLDVFTTWLGYFCPLVRVLEFTLGCLAAQLYLSLAERRPDAREERMGRYALTMAVLSIVALIVIKPPPAPPCSDLYGFLNMNFLYAPALAVILFCSCRYQTRWREAFSHKYIVALGEVSFSTYLIHPWVLSMFQYGGIPRFSVSLFMESLFRMIVSVGLTLILSFGTYWAIEAPGRRWLRRLFMGGEAASPRVPSRVGWVAAICLLPLLGLAVGYSFDSLSRKFRLGMEIGLASERGSEANGTLQNPKSELD